MLHSSLLSFLTCLFSLSCLFVCREQKQQFQELVELKFHEWLIETGHRQELDSLMPPTVTSAKDLDGAAKDASRVKHTKATGTE